MVIAMATSDPLPSTGGVQNVIIQLARSLAQEGHRCVALAPGREGPSSWETLVIERAQMKPFSLRAWLRDPWLLFREVQRCRKFLLRHEADVAHLHSLGTEAFYMALAAWSLRVGVVATVHGFRDFGTLTRFGLWMERLTYLLCNVVTACCEADRRGILRRHPVLAGRTRTVPNAVDMKALVPIIQPSIPGRVVFLGRFTRQKGVDVLLRAWKIVESQHSEAELLVGGSGPDEPALLDMVTELGLERIRWAGLLEPQAAVQVLSTASIVCMPSRWEGMPLVALEAMAVGRALVASDVDGVPEVVEHERTGLLVDPEDPEALAKSLLQLLCDPARVSSLGDASRRRVEEHFCWERVYMSYVSAYNDARRIASR